MPNGKTVKAKENPDVHPASGLPVVDVNSLPIGQVLEGLPDSVYIKDRQGVFLWVNTACARKLGVFDRNAVIGKHDRDFFTPAMAEHFTQVEDRILRTGIPVFLSEEKENWEDGHVSYAQVSKMPLRDGQGKIFGLLGITRDVTERVQAEQILQASELRYRSVVEQITEGIMLVEPDTWKIHDANPALLKLLGYRAEEILNLTIFDIIADTREEIRERGEQAQRTGYMPLERRNFRHKDGSTIEVEREARIIELDARQIMCVVVHDLRHRRVMEEKLREAQQAETVGRLASGLAHDFNNFLTVISGYCEMLLKPGRLDGKAEKSVRHIADTAAKASALIQQLLAFGRKQVLNPKKLQLEQTLSGMREMIARMLQDPIELIWQAESQPGPVLADPLQLEQVLLNLAANARDAMPNGGTLWITLRRRKLAAHLALTPDIIPAGNYAEIEVRDNGIGMDAATMRQIFEPFFSTKGQRGNGLGLAMVHGIVRQSGGYIGVESEPGQGATFHIFLPEV